MFLILRDTAGQERFRTITTAYYRGAMGIMLVYDITNEKSFENIKNWIRNIEENASADVEKMLLGEYLIIILKCVTVLLIFLLDNLIQS